MKVYDSSNNLVANYNGPVTLTSSAANQASLASSGDVASTTVNAVNGVATFTVYSGRGAAAGQTPTLTASVSGASTVTGTAQVKVD